MTTERAPSACCRFALLPAILVALGLAAACSGTPADHTDATSADVSLPDAAARDAMRIDVGPGDDAEPDGAVPDAAPVTSCDQMGSAECFSNYDCPETMRCENVGPVSDPVPCCVAGARGAGRAGEPCQSEGDCASGICIEHEGSGRCSDRCARPEDCPAGMQRCIHVALSGSDDKWCFPE